jgi:hypothetical protein
MRGFFGAKDFSTAWLGLDKGLGRHAFRVDPSKDYNLVVREEFLEAIRGLVSIFRYFLSGEVKVGAFQVAFHNKFSTLNPDSWQNMLKRQRDKAVQCT